MISLSTDRSMERVSRYMKGINYLAWFVLSEPYHHLDYVAQEGAKQIIEY